MADDIQRLGIPLDGQNEIDSESPHQYSLAPDDDDSIEESIFFQVMQGPSGTRRAWLTRPVRRGFINPKVDRPPLRAFAFEWSFNFRRRDVVRASFFIKAPDATELPPTDASRMAANSRYRFVRKFRILTSPVSAVSAVSTVEKAHVETAEDLELLSSLSVEIWSDPAKKLIEIVNRITVHR